KDLADIPDNVKEGLEIIPVTHVRDVLKLALTGTPEAVEWDEEAAADAAMARATAMPGGSEQSSTAH
ncbi:MAG: S16 family serine protease, partial [Pseudomonadota bacterium]|nr:S16 family serine protease [Pseudomonadota bacterium]